MRFRTSISTMTSGSAYAVYDFIAMAPRYSQINDAPVISNLLFNNQEDIIATSGFNSVTEYVYVTADVYDAQGCNTILTPTGCAFRSGSPYGSCAGFMLGLNYNASEALSCDILNCSGAGDTTATISCPVSANYVKDPTDYGTP